MSLRLIQEGVCLPLTLEEVKSFLAVNSNSSDENQLLENLIMAASSEAENITGRVWVESKWEWVVDGGFQSNTLYELPICPVTKVEVFDLDEVVDEGAMPTDISGGLVKVDYPSLSPQGTPLVGSLLANNVFPQNSKIVLTVGYPVKSIETLINPNTVPILAVESISFTSTKIHLVFDRPVKGTVKADNFQVKLVSDGSLVEPQSVVFENQGLSLEFLDGELIEGETPELSFVGGFIEDDFSNFVEPINTLLLPAVVFGTEEDFVLPQPYGVEVRHEASVPKQIKQWMLMRIGTWFSQRSEVASKGLGYMYPASFIDNLIKQYKVEFV